MSKAVYLCYFNFTVPDYCENKLIQSKKIKFIHSFDDNKYIFEGVVQIFRSGVLLGSYDLKLYNLTCLIPNK